MIALKQLLVGAGMAVGFAMWAGAGLAFDGNSAMDTLGVPLDADALSDERAGGVNIGIAFNEGSQDVNQTSGDNTTVNAGNVSFGQNNSSLASTFVTNTGGPNVTLLGQTSVVINIHTNGD